MSAALSGSSVNMTMTAVGTLAESASCRPAGSRKERAGLGGGAKGGCVRGLKGQGPHPGRVPESRGTEKAGAAAAGQGLSLGRGQG